MAHAENQFLNGGESEAISPENFLGCLEYAAFVVCCRYCKMFGLIIVFKELITFVSIF